MEIRPFQGQYEELADLIARAWPLEHKGHAGFSAEYLRFLLSAPDVDRELTLAAFVGGRPTAFLLSKSKRLVIGGERRRGLFQTLATADPRHSHEFPYLKIKDRCVRMAQERGYELSYGFIAQGIRNNEIEKSYAARRGFSCILAAAFGWFAGLPDDATGTGKDAVLEIREPVPQELTDCRSLMEEGIRTRAVFEEWTPTAFAYRAVGNPFNQPLLVLKDGIAVGWLLYTRLTMQYPRVRRKVAVVYDLFLQRLTGTERTWVFRRLKNRCAEEGIEGISIPNTGSLPKEDLRNAGFLESSLGSHRTNLYFTFFGDDRPVESGLSFYLEII